MLPHLNEEQQRLIANITQEVQKKIFFLKHKKSFYIYGGTGSGKTTAIECFASTSTRPVLFMHFHDYLLDISRLAVKLSLQKIAKLIAKNFNILCFDEFFIESIADAKILQEIFLHLIQYNVSVIITSNFKPEHLYQNGFNRELAFPAFSNFIHTQMNVVEFINKSDYRTLAGNTKTQVAFANVEQFATHFKVNIDIQKESLFIDFNHKLEIIGRFTNGVIIDYSIFQKNSSIKDYRHLARKFEHIHIANMQCFDTENEDEAIRFRNFVDIIYMRSTILTWHGNAGALFGVAMLKNIKFKRCNSRLVQIATQEYIASHIVSFKRAANLKAAIFFENILHLNL